MTEESKLAAAFENMWTSVAQNEVLSGKVKSRERNPILAALKHEHFFCSSPLFFTRDSR